MPSEKVKPTCLRCRERPVHVKKRQLCRNCYQFLRRSAGETAPSKRGRKPLTEHVKAEREAARIKKEQDREARIAERHAPVLALAESGLTLQAIADQLGVTRERIRQILLRYGVSVRSYRKRKTTQDPQEKALRRRERLMSTILANVASTDEGMCWDWIGPTKITNAKYPDYHVPYMYAPDPLHEKRGRSTPAYRVAYMLFVGPIPEGMRVDRICYNRLCCNPAHLQLLTKKDVGRRKNPLLMERLRGPRKTHCVHGHLLEGENLYLSPSGGRQCRACQVANRSKCERKTREIEGSSDSTEGQGREKHAD